MIGHDDVRAELERSLPPVTLLYGPRSVGKTTLAEHLVAHYGIRRYDVQRYERLRVDDAREVRQFTTTLPLSKFKAVIINLDDATAEAVNSLLKLLEEPPATVRFILIASRPTLLTVQSRAAVFRMGFLTTDEVTKVLVERLGHDRERAERLAAYSGGQVEAALKASDLDYTRGPVLTLLRAVAEGDHELLANGFNNFGPDQVDLLRTWTVEARTRVWRVFNPSDDSGLHKDVLAVDRMAQILAMGARPKIAGKLALIEALEDRRARR